MGYWEDVSEWFDEEKALERLYFCRKNSENNCEYRLVKKTIEILER